MFPYTTNVTLVAEWHKIVNPIHLLLITLHMMLPPLLFDAHDNNQDPTGLLALFARRGNEESWFWHPDDDLCQCFFSLTQLDSESLLRLRTTLTSLDSKYQERFSVDIERGIRDIDWVIMEKQLYSNLMTLGDAPTVESDAIVSDDSSEDATNSDYLRVLLADRKWTELSKMEVSEFLAYGDWQSLTADAYNLVVLACLRHTIEAAEHDDGELLDHIPHLLSLHGHDRVSTAPARVAAVVATFIQLFSTIPWKHRMEVTPELLRWPLPRPT